MLYMQCQEIKLRLIMRISNNKRKELFRVEILTHLIEKENCRE